MTDQDGLGTAEQQQLAYGLETRFAPHPEAAASAVRRGERELAEAREKLARAEEEAEGERYRSDPLVFMRELVDEEVEGLTRKTTPKKLRTAYRFLLDRAVDLAASEVTGFGDDQARAEHQREHGLEACREAERRAAEALEAARAMQERVRAAEQAARRGLAVLEEKLNAPEDGGG
jgi:hypothetical protein